MPTSAGRSSQRADTPLSAEQLAALVDESVADSAGMLFTATPSDELAEIRQFQRIKDRGFVGQMRAIVAAYNRASERERQFACDEVALTVRVSSGTGGHLVAQALELAALPGLLEAVDAGQLTERHALAVLRELNKVELSLEQRVSVVLVMLAKYAGQTPSELAALVERLIVQVDRAAAATREARAAAERKVWFSRDVDGQAVLLARGPAAAIAAIRASLEASLTEAEPGDERNHGAREFDLFCELLTGGAQPGQWTAAVIVPFSTVEGGERELAEIPGLGPILPSTARDLLEDCVTVSQIAVDEDGEVIAAGEPLRVVPRPVFEGHVRLERPVLPDPIRAKLAAPPTDRDLTGAGYRFPPRLQRLLEARDRTCVFPGCNRPARKADKDHRIPWPAGRTSADNGQCLCRHHHRAKHAVFTVLHDGETGDYVWITRGGWEFRRHPKGY